MTPRTAPPGLVAALATRFGDRLSTAQAVRERRGRDEPYQAPSPPDAMVFPRNAIGTFRLLHGKK